MKTVSVKQVAAALGVTPRAIIYRLEKGDLKGIRTPNPYGVQEWRIYPTREIAEKIRPACITEVREASPEIDFESDTVDAVEAESVSEQQPVEQKEANWLDTERDKLKILAEEMTRPLVDTIRQQEQIIVEQKRQLRLLPDLEKRASEEAQRAEAQRQVAELKTLETIALKKQIAEMAAEKEQLAAKANEASMLSNDLELLKAKVEQLQQPWWKKWFANPANTASQVQSR